MKFSVESTPLCMCRVRCGTLETVRHPSFSFTKFEKRFAAYTLHDSNEIFRICGLFHTQGRQSEKNSGGGLKGSQGETRIRVEGGVLLGGESSQKL